MAPKNEAAFLLGAKSALRIKEALYTLPGPNELAVQNRAVAINIVDAAKQLLGDTLLDYVKMPCVQGSDLAGDVVEVGSAVSRFKAGDRVLAYAAGTLPFGNRLPEGAFQRYTVIREHMAALLPATTPYEHACQPKSTNQAVVITSGASSVGASAVQLAAAAGYDVYTTASPKNFDFVQGLGAVDVLDYHKSSCVDDMATALQSKKVAGALSIGLGGVAICAQVLNRTDSIKFIADAGPPPPEGYPEGIKSKFIIDLQALPEPGGVVGRIFEILLPMALLAGQLVPAPKPWVVGNGLQRIQEALDIRWKGVSAQKVVVTL
ncbi:GroES-like protein [Camillea tinctor]|nr:GroES-like protein [Camillea tinctor]